MSRNNNGRLITIVGIGILVFIIVSVFANAIDRKPSVLSASSESSSVAADRSTVPWDYKIEEAKVGDLIGGDMTILPNNQLLPNDDNYGTGDSIWVLSYMNATMNPQDDGKNNVTLSAWTPIKSYRTQDAAQKDLDNLKVQVKTDVDLVGVYKTEYQGKFREFAMVALPSGHTIKQPVDEARYNALKTKKQVKVLLEEVHDYSNYDQTMAKFRGWAE